MTPKLWPERMKYAREPFSVEIHPTFLQHFLSTGNPLDLEAISKVVEGNCVHPSVEIKKIRKPHPLWDKTTLQGHPNYGLFAKGKIKKGSEIGEYVGEIYLRTGTLENIIESWSLEYAWVIVLNASFFLIIDACRVANEMAMVNDYHGISDEPNVKMIPVIHRGVYHFCFVAISDIQKGEELLIDYGKSQLRIDTVN